MIDQQNGKHAISVDIIRVVAISLIILVHAISNLAIETISNIGFLRWLIIVDIYQSVSYMGVPLFIMLTGALLLEPSKKDESIRFFFKKRFSRIGLPFLFWGIIHFIWVFYVEHQPMTMDFIINGILKGPFFTFWYLYMLVGLYLITPLLRVMVANFTDKHFKYFIALWFVGISLIPLMEFISGRQFYLNVIVFLIPLCVGYFVIGSYLSNVKIKRWILGVLTVLGLALTIISIYLTVGIGGDTTFFFKSINSPTMILATLSFFMLLNSYAKPREGSQTENPSWKQRLIHTISKNSLPIYLSHMIVFYSLQILFSFTLNNYSIDPIIGIPIMAVLTLLFSLLIIVPLKKIPILEKLIG